MKENTVSRRPEAAAAGVGTARRRLRHVGRWPALLPLLILSACQYATPQPVLTTSSAEQAVSAIDEGLAREAPPEPPAEIPPEVLSQLLPPPVDDEPEERFDLSVNGVGAEEFFRGLVRGTDFNMVVHPEVNGEISLDLKSVTVLEVMTVMRDVYGYDFDRDGRFFRVFPDALRTEIFQVDYLNVERKGRSQMQVSAGKVGDSQRGGGQQFGGYGYGDSGFQSGGQGGGSSQRNVVGTQINTNNEVDFWAELQTTLQTIVGSEPGTSVVVTPQVGLAVVRARPEALSAVRSYLGQVRGSLHRQVILEAKIVEVTLNSAFQAGIDWNTFGAQSGGSFFPTDTSPGSPDDVGARFAFGEGSEFFNPLGSTFALAGKIDDFEAVLTLLETQGTVQILSSPRISTVNNQKAVIKVGSDEFFVTDISTTTVTAGSAINTNDSPELTPFFSGIALDVTPQIGTEGQIILHVHPTVSEVEEQLKVISGEPIPLAASTIRESDSVVRARDGQVVVIGGLMQNISRDNDAGVPWISKVPVLGYAFSHKQQNATKSELVILLRAHIVDDQTMRKSLEGSRDRLRGLIDELRPAAG